TMKMRYRFYRMRYVSRFISLSPMWSRSEKRSVRFY
ncbi:hypothetical protein CP061683_0008B, partial [Chlamydia psittaci 06-1683]